MTITILAPDGVQITAKQWRQARAAEHGGGAGRRLGGRSGFRVDTPSNVLTVTSTTWTLGPCAAMIDPMRVTNQGMYGWASDANITGSIEPAHDTYTRIDRLFVDLLDDTAGDGSGEIDGSVTYQAGQPSATPQAPNYAGLLVGTITVPPLGGGSPTVQLNPARYVAAGGILPVSSQAERDAIPDKFDGLTVRRMDVTSRHEETWNGTKWTATDLPWTTLTLTDLFDHASGSGWSGVKYAVRNGWFILSGAATRGNPWGDDQRIADIPAGLRPDNKIQGSGVQVATDGVVYLPAGGIAASFSATWPLF